MDARKPDAHEDYWQTYCVVCTWTGTTKYHTRDNQVITAELAAHMREVHPQPPRRVVQYLAPAHGADLWRSP